MNKLKLKLSKKQLVLMLLIGGGVLVLAGIILLATVAPLGRPGFFKTMITLIFVLMILLGGWLVLAAYVNGKSTDAHFFRYDKNTGRNIPVRELTFDVINRRLSQRMYDVMGPDYMTVFWHRDIFEENDDVFGVDRVLAPLFAYKALLDLARVNRDECWVLFTKADRRLVKHIANELEEAGEKDMPDDLLKIYDDAANTDYIDNIKSYLTDNRGYLQHKMKEYVVAEDEKFY